MDNKKDIIFEVFDKSGRKIRLTKERWSHIRQDHPDVESSYDIKETIINPIKVLYLEKHKVIF